MKKITTASIVSTGADYAHHIRAGNFDLITDEPAKLGGQDTGPAPFDLYLASLSACTAITLRMYAQKKGWKLGEFRADLELAFDDDGKPHIHRILHSNQPLTDEQWARLQDVVERTPVTKVMRDGATITSARGV